LAKVACGVAKPNGLLVIQPDDELAFLHALPVERLWGVGTVTAEKLRKRGIETVADVAKLGDQHLIAMVGRAAGRHLHALARNYDPRPVDVKRRRRSIGSQRALGRRRRSPEDLDAIVLGLIDRLARRLRAAHRVCRTVTLRMRFDDFTRATRSHTVPESTAQTHVLLDAARTLLAAELSTIRDRGITLIGVTFGNLDDDSAVQLTLPIDRLANTPLDAALDDLRDRFGTSSITRAALLNRDQGVSVPLLPD
jgi:DNA polymerase-4